MIFSLLYVGLLCMGVGAKASTPIYNNRNTQKQQRQLQEENENNYTLVNTPITGINDIEYNDYDIDETDTYYAGNQYLREKYNITTTNVSCDVIHVGHYEFEYNKSINEPETDWYSLDETVYFDPYKTYSNEPCDIYVIKIDGTFKAFENTDIHIYVSNYIQNNTTTPYEFHYSMKVETFTTAADNEGLNDVFVTEDFNTALLQYNSFKNGKLKTQSSYAENILEDHKTIGIGGNNILIPNKINYIYAYVKYIWYSNEVGNNYFNQQIRNNGDTGLELVSNYLENTQRSQQQITDIYFPFSPIEQSMMPRITLRYKNITGITVEVIDIPGLIWEILSMPFAFFSTAFNLTLFPGTNYQINISNLILTVFGVLVFIFILKIFIKR